MPGLLCNVVHSDMLHLRWCSSDGVAEHASGVQEALIAKHLGCGAHSRAYRLGCDARPRTYVRTVCCFAHVAVCIVDIHNHVKTMQTDRPDWEYIAPENFAGGFTDQHGGSAENRCLADVYAFGIVALEMASTFLRPFKRPRRDAVWLYLAWGWVDAM